MVVQYAVNQADQFNQLLGIDGVILTKLDSDARGGAALSISYIINKPIKFIGVSERIDGLELFYPDRMASRILGMGDIVSLVEKAENSITKEDAAKLTKKISSEGLDFNDMLKQFQMLKKMGSFESILKLIPGLGKLPKVDIRDDKIKRIEAIIFSMTPYERKNYKALNSSRKKRIAYGSGTTVNDINKLTLQLQQMNKMLKTFKYKNGDIKKFDNNLIKSMFSR
jgi:signal recognition particle subunit SRP54